MEDGYSRPEVKRPRHRVYLRPSLVHAGDDPPWVEMDDKTRHHLRQVLRLGKGARLAVIDGQGREYICEITESKPSRMTAAIIEINTPAVESSLQITVAQAMIKAPALERLLVSCTELGCAAFVPLIASRSVARPGKRDLAEKLARWQAIIQAAAAQSERVRVPAISPPTALEDWLAVKHAGAKLLLRERGPGKTGPGWPEVLGSSKEIVLLAGPEGGFTDQEVAAALNAGYFPISLGPRILRAEHAAPAACAILQHCLGS